MIWFQFDTLQFTENTDKYIDKLVLVAPWLNSEKDDKYDPDMFAFKLSSEVAQRVKKIIVLYSTDDDDGIIQSVEEIRSSITGVEYIEFENKGHFIEEDMGSNKFPELLSVIVD